MGFFKSLKGDHASTIGGADSQSQDPSGLNSSQGKQGRGHRGEKENYNPPPGAPPTWQNDYISPTGPPPGHGEYAPPLGPPPGHGEYTPPPGPPPGREEYAPPSGPPPSHRAATDSEAPAYHDWTSVPDNALLPPPPSMGHEISTSSNADTDDAVRAHDWCRANPLIRPHQPTNDQHTAIHNGDVRLMKPREYKGDLLMPSTGTWKGFTRAGAKDACLLTSSPLYFAAADSPLRTRLPKTIYYEVECKSLGHGPRKEECSVAIGYCAMPYPTWRMPGWERASLAVHSDDGHRYVNDTWGGKDFTSPIQSGDTIGLGMTFSVPESPPDYHAAPKAGSNIDVEVFFTRNGRREGGWNLHEELDAKEDLGVDGLDGQFDLYGAVGVFGGVDFEVKFKREEWLWRPR